MSDERRNKYGRRGLILLIFALLVGCCLYFGCRTPVLQPVDFSRIPDGVYSGRSFKFPGPMVVEVELKAGKIAAIRLVKHAALKKYSNMMEPLIARIIEQQKADVDGVTGATISSRAFKLAVHDALATAAEQAKQAGKTGKTD